MRFATLSQSVLISLATLAFGQPTLAQQGCPQADAFEPNNDCNNTATPMANWQWFANLTVTGPQSPLGVDPDFFSITVPAYSSIAVECWFTDADGDIDVWLWDESTGNCPSHTQGEYLQNGFSTNNNEFFSWDNDTGIDVDCIIGVQYFNLIFDCNEYDLRAIVTPLLACPGPDRFEPNETCATSTQLAVGMAAALSITGDVGSPAIDVDSYHYTLDSNEVLNVDVLFAHAEGNIDCRLYHNEWCITPIDTGLTLTDNESVTYANDTGAAVELKLRVIAHNIIPPDPHCANYSLSTTVGRVPCTSAVEDLLAPNHSCATATPMVEGVTDSLFVSKASSDYFEVLLAADEHIAVTTYFEDDVSDVDLALYDAADPGCGVSNHLVLSQSTDDFEYVSYTNTSGAPKLFAIKVFVWPGMSNPDCNNYHMEIETTLPDVGVWMCFGNGLLDVGGGPVACPCGNESSQWARKGCENSTGGGARLSGAGSTSVAVDNLVLVIGGAPSSQPGLFVQGKSTIALPLKDGILCMGNPTRRLGVVFTDASGQCSSDFSIATEGNTVPGETRYYQYWYRDSGGGSPCGTGSNFSSGLRVDYTP